MSKGIALSPFGDACNRLPDEIPEAFSFAALLVMAGSGMWWRQTALAIEASRAGFLSCRVMITDEQGLPVRGTRVRLLDSGNGDPNSQDDLVLRARMGGLERPAVTDPNGAAVVSYHARWVSSDADKNRTFHHKPRGKIVVEAKGYERVEAGGFPTALLRSAWLIARQREVGKPRRGFLRRLASRSDQSCDRSRLQY